MLKNNNERCIELDGGNEDTTTNNFKNNQSNMSVTTAITTVHTKISPIIHLAPLSTLISTPPELFSPPPVLLVVDDNEPCELEMESAETLSSESRINSVSAEADIVSDASTCTAKALKDQTSTTITQQQQQKQLMKVAGPQQQQRQLSLQEKKRLRQQNPVEKIFPHIAITHKQLRILHARPIGSTLQQELIKVINAYIAGCRNEYEENTSSPYKCRRLAHSMTRTMDLMQQICAPFEYTPEYIHRMIELVAIYLSCELRYAKEFKEHKPLIANRILYNIYKYLKGSNKDETMDYILRMFAYMPRMYREREVMTKIFQTLIPKEQIIIQRELPDSLYIQYIIVFYHWKQLEPNHEQQMHVIEFANKFMRPAKTLCTNSTYAYHLPNYTCLQTATKFILQDLKFFHDLRNASIYDHRLQLDHEVIDISDEEHPKLSKTSVNVDFAELVQNAETQPTVRPMVKLENQVVIATIDLTLQDTAEDDLEWLQELQRNAKKLEPTSNALSLLNVFVRNSTLPDDNSAAASEVIEIDSDTDGEEDNNKLEQPVNLLLTESEQLSDHFLEFEESDQAENLSDDNSLKKENAITVNSNKNTDHIKLIAEDKSNDASSIVRFSQQSTQVFPTEFNIISVCSIGATQTESDCSVALKSKVMPELLQQAKPKINDMRSIAATQTEDSYIESAIDKSTDTAAQFLPSKPTIIEILSIAKTQSNNNNNSTPLATSTELELTQINPQISKTLNADLINESSKQAVTSEDNDTNVSCIDDILCRRNSLHLLSSPIRSSGMSYGNNDTNVPPDINANDDDVVDDDESEICFFGSTPNSRMVTKTSLDTNAFNNNKVIYSVAASTCPPLQKENTGFMHDDESPNIKQQSVQRNNVSQKTVQFSNKPLQRTGGNPITHPIKPAIKNSNSTYNNQSTPINSAVLRLCSASPASSTSSLSRTFQKENKTDTDNLIISTQPTSNSLKLSSNEAQNDSNLSVLNNDAIVNENQVVSNNDNQLVEKIDKDILTLTQAVDISSTNFNELSVTSTCDELCAASQDATTNTDAAVAGDAADSQQQLDDISAEQATKEPLDIDEEISTVVGASNSPETSINWQEEDKNTYYDLEEFLILHKRRESQDIAAVNHSNVCNLPTNSNTNTSNNDCELDSDLEFDFDFVFGLDFDAMTPTTAVTIAATTTTTQSMHISTNAKYVDSYNVETDKLLDQFNVATDHIVETVISTSELQERPISSPTLTSTCNNNNRVHAFSATKKTSAISSTTSPESLAIKGAKMNDIIDDEDNVDLPLELENELLINADDDLLPPSELITDAELLKEFVTIPTMTSKSPKPTTETKEHNKLVSVHIDVDASDLLEEYVTKKSSIGEDRDLPKTDDLLKELVVNTSKSSVHKTEEVDEEDLCVLKNLSESSLGASNDVLDNAELLQEFVMIPTVSTKLAKQEFEATNKELANSNTEIEVTDLLHVFGTIPKIKAKAPEHSMPTNNIDASEALAAEETTATSEGISMSGPESSHFEESLDETYAMSRRVLMRNIMSANNSSAFADPQQVEITLPLKKRRKISEFQDELEANSNATATLTEEEEEDEPTSDIVEKNNIKTVANASDASSGSDGSQTMLALIKNTTVSKPEGTEIDLAKTAIDAELTKPLETTSNCTALNPQPPSATQPKPILLPTNSSPPQNKQVQIVAPQIKELIKPIDTITSSNLQVFLTPLAESYPAEPMLSIANFENLVHLQRYLDTLVTSTHISKTIDAALAVTHIFQEFSAQGSHSTLIATIEKLLSAPSPPAAAEETLASAGDNDKLLLKIHLEGSISILVDNNNVSEWMKLPPATAALLTQAAKSLSKWEKYKQQQQIKQNKLLCDQINTTKPITELSKSTANPADDEDEQILEIRAHDLINKMLPGQRNVPLPKKENMLFDLQMAEIRIKQQQQQNDASNAAIINYKDTQSALSSMTNFKDTPNVASSISTFKDVQTAAVAPLEATQQQKVLAETTAQTTRSAATTPAPTPVPELLSSTSTIVNPIVTTTNAEQTTAQPQFVDQHVVKIIEAQKLLNSIDQNKNAQNSITSHQKNPNDLENMNMRFYDGLSTSSSNTDFLTAAKHMPQYAADEINSLNCPPRSLSATQLLKHAAKLSSSKYLRHNSSSEQNASEKSANAGVGMMQSILQQQNDLFQNYTSNNFCADQHQQQPHISSSYQEIYQHSQTYVQSSNFANLQQQIQFPTLLHSSSMSESAVEAAETIDISQLKLPYTKAGEYQSLKNTPSDKPPGEFQSTMEQLQQHQRHLVMAEKRKQFEEIIKQRDIDLQQQQRQQQRDFEEQQRRTADYEALRLSFKDDLMQKNNKEQRLSQHQQRYMQKQLLQYEKLNKAKNEFEELQRKKLQYEWLQEFTARQQQQQQFQQQLTTTSSVSTSSSNTTTLPPTEASAKMASKRRRLEECHSNNLTLNMITDMNQTAKSIADRGTQNVVATPPKRGRGRPRKYPLATEAKTVAKPGPITRGRGRYCRHNNNNSATGKLTATTATTPPTTLVTPTLTMPKTCVSNMLLYPPSKAINTNANNTTTTSAGLYNPYGGIFSAPVNFSTPQLSPKISSTDMPTSLDVPSMISTCVDILPLSQNI